MLQELQAPPRRRGEQEVRTTERRLARRVLALWKAACAADGTPPKPAAIRPAEFGEDWRWCFILDVARSDGFPYFLYLGEDLATYSGVLLSGCPDWRCTVLDRATQEMHAVAASGRPALVENELTLYDGRRLLFRSTLLPLSADGTRICQILGAANGKVVEAA